jgi:hypothetical protein
MQMSSGFSGTAWDDFFDPLGVLSYRSSCSEFFRRKSTSAVSCWILVTTLFVVRRAKQGASYQVKVLLFQNLASRNYRVLQLC